MVHRCMGVKDLWYTGVWELKTFGIQVYGVKDVFAVTPVVLSKLGQSEIRSQTECRTLLRRSY